MNLPKWLEEIKENYNHLIITLIGNACDDYERRKVTKEEAEKLARENNLKYFEVSAKENRNIKEGISEIVNDINDSRGKKDKTGKYKLETLKNKGLNKIIEKEKNKKSLNKKENKISNIKILDKYINF